jgi:predicted DNA-binding ribbon-helix-helix protein
MKSPVIKRSIVIAGHKTSVSLEDAFWRGLKEIAVSRHVTLSDLVASIDSGRPHGNLSSAIRLFVLSHYQAGANGHGEAHPNGHGNPLGNGHGAVGPDQGGHHDVMLGAPPPASVLRPE